MPVVSEFYGIKIYQNFSFDVNHVYESEVTNDDGLYS